jgi:hypothetical protein
MVRIFDTFEAGLGRLTRFLAVLVAISIGLITVLIPLNLLLVKTQLGGLWWLYEAVEYALYVGVFIGARRPPRGQSSRSGAFCGVSISKHTAPGDLRARRRAGAQRTLRRNRRIRSASGPSGDHARKVSK